MLSGGPKWEKSLQVTISEEKDSQFLSRSFDNISVALLVTRIISNNWKPTGVD